MFKHFVGKIYILEPPPDKSETQLSLNFPDELLGDIDESDYEQELTKEQIAKIISYKDEMSGILGNENFKSLNSSGALESSNSLVVRDIARDVAGSPEGWNGLAYLNSDDVDTWDHYLYKAIQLQPEGWGTRYSNFVGFIKILSKNWTHSLPELLHELDTLDIGIDKFFKLERTVTFKLAALLNDINVINKTVSPDKGVDISPFINKITNAFLPATVYQLEEYGLPRMMTKKIHVSGLINFENSELTLHSSLQLLREIGIHEVSAAVNIFSDFDHYILDYFYQGITPRVSSVQ